MAVSCLELFGVLLLRLVKVLYQTVTNKVIPYHGATTQILSLHPFRAMPLLGTLRASLVMSSNGVAALQALIL